MTTYSAHWGGRKTGRAMLHDVRRTRHGDIVGVAAGQETGFPSSSYPDRTVTVPAAVVKQRRFRFRDSAGPVPFEAVPTVEAWSSAKDDATDLANHIVVAPNEEHST